LDKGEERAKFTSYRTYWLERRPDKQLIEEQARAAEEQARAIRRRIDIEILQDWKRERETWKPEPEPAVNGNGDLSGQVGQVVRNGSDNVSGTGRTNGAPILRTVESLKKKSASAPEILKTGAAAAAADEGKTPSPPRTASASQNKPEPDEFEPVRDHLHSLDPTATDKQVDELVANCRSVRGDIRPGLLLQVILHLTAKSEGLRSPVAFLGKRAPEFLRSRKAFDLWVANGAGPPETKEQAERRRIKELLRSHAQNLKTAAGV
jgi:hypothetical protein